MRSDRKENKVKLFINNAVISTNGFAVKFEHYETGVGSTWTSRLSH